LLSSYKGNVSELSNIEQFLIIFITVPSLNERLECMLFKNRFEYDYTEIKKNMEAVNSAVIGIRDNSKLKEVITMILKIGNFLNFGTNKGKAQGF
jgi:diaphanous 1